MLKAIVPAISNSARAQARFHLSANCFPCLHPSHWFTEEMVGDPHIPHNNYWDLECPRYSLGHLIGLPVLLLDQPRLLPVSEGITHIPSTLPLFPVPFWPYLNGLPKGYHSLDISGHHHSSCCSLTAWSPGIFMFVLGSPVSTSSASQWFTKVMLCLSQSHYLCILRNISHISTTHRPSTLTQSSLQLIANRPSTPTLDFISTHHRPRYNLLHDPFPKFQLRSSLVYILFRQ